MVEPSLLVRCELADDWREEFASKSFRPVDLAELVSLLVPGRSGF
jgi:hypothetical protein